MKFYDIVQKIFVGKVGKDDREKLIINLQSYNLLNDLFPFLLKQKLVCHFYELIVNEQLIPFMNKEMWRALNKIIIYESMRSRQYYEETKVICQELHDYDIPYAFIKGVHLKNIIYNDNSSRIQRSFNDIDILVRKNDIKQINSILLKLGYFKGEYDPETHSLRKYSRAEEINFLINSHQTPQYIKPSPFSDITSSDILIVDINFTIFFGGMIQDKIDSRQLLNDRIIREDSGGNRYYSLKLEDDLLQLIYHIYKDSTYEIKKKDNEDLILCSLVDVYRFIEKKGPEIDWESFINRANHCNIIKEIEFVLKRIKIWITNDYIEDLLFNLTIN